MLRIQGLLSCKTAQVPRHVWHRPAKHAYLRRNKHDRSHLYVLSLTVTLLAFSEIFCSHVLATLFAKFDAETFHQQLGGGSGQLRSVEDATVGSFHPHAFPAPGNILFDFEVLLRCAGGFVTPVQKLAECLGPECAIQGMGTECC